jgi:hypothetical protein
VSKLRKTGKLGKTEHLRVYKDGDNCPEHHAVLAHHLSAAMKRGTHDSVTLAASTTFILIRIPKAGDKLHNTLSTT